MSLVCEYCKTESTENKHNVMVDKGGKLTVYNCCSLACQINLGMRFKNECGMAGRE